MSTTALIIETVDPILRGLPDRTFWGAVAPSLIGNGPASVVMSDMIGLASSTKDEIVDTVDGESIDVIDVDNDHVLVNSENVASSSESLNQTGTIKDVGYIAVMTGYSVADDTFTAPVWQSLRDAASEMGLSQVGEQILAGSGLVAISTAIAFTLCKAAEKYRERHGEIVDKSTISAGDPKDYELTYAIGAPLRTHLRELNTDTEYFKHALAYATIGQLVVYNTIGKIGETAGAGESNAFFYTALMTFIAAKYTEDIYPKHWAAESFKAVVNPLRIPKMIKNYLGDIRTRKNDNVTKKKPVDSGVPTAGLTG